MRRTDYGRCPYCGASLRPEWFEEDEFRDGHPTGRKRLAGAILFCIKCFSRFNVDDTFDYGWRRG